MSYDTYGIHEHNSFRNWRVTRSLVSYDLLPTTVLQRLKLKGHQIIGELRLPLISTAESSEIEGSPDHWWVTTLRLPSVVLLLKLKGHQIIGELRQVCGGRLYACFHWRVTRSLVSYDCRYVVPNAKCWHWRVTRSLVSYDLVNKIVRFFILIEGSPDHWWVTTTQSLSKIVGYWLKGHQIIGELRPLMGYLLNSSLEIEGSPDHWWVTTSLIDFEHRFCSIEGSPDHWWVTTQQHQQYPTHVILKGHQIIGELRLLFKEGISIVLSILKGHQIIGELRHNTMSDSSDSIDWRVTRSLVSYDIFKMIFDRNILLKGHQIIGELRLGSMIEQYCSIKLKGHQIIGELRHTL